MKNCLVIALAAFALSGSAWAGPQQERMKTCNLEAKDMHGDARKDFMKKCLSGKTEEATKAASTPQERMKDCNMKAKGKKGEERKSFMSSCLKG